ncbi:MAG: ADOP family duplicated permease [Blastocatellia bacterium]
MQKKKVEDDLRAEVSSYVDLLIEERAAAGLNPKEARRAALIALGGVEQVKQHVREVRVGYMLETIFQDLRFGARMILKNPLFTAAVVVTLTLGIGATTAIFSVVNTVLLAPLPFKDADRLVMVWATSVRRTGGEVVPVTPADFQDWKARNHVFDEMAGSTDWSYTLTGAGEPAQLNGYRLEANAFNVLGVKPLIGQIFGEEQTRTGNDTVAVLSYDLWQDRFGGDKSILGKTITLSGDAYTVIGVMPNGFAYPAHTDLWTPLILRTTLWSNRDRGFFRTIARLKPGVSIKKAQAEMDSIASSLQQEYPQTNTGRGIRIVSMRDMSVGDIRPALLVLLCAVGLVLLIACANIANLLLARATSRNKEIAVRRALGAGRGRLVRQLLTESTLIAMFGGVSGLALTVPLTRALVTMFPNNIANVNIPVVEKIPIGGMVLAFALLASLATGLLFGVAPAFQSSRLDVNQILKESGTSSMSSKGRRLRELLVIAEVSLALVLLIGAGLLIESFTRLQQARFGFNPENVLTMEVFLPPNKYPDAQSRSRFLNDSLAKVRGVYGVKSADAISYLPLSGFWGVLTFLPEGQSLPDNQWPEADNRVVSPGYFATIGTPILTGRAFDEHDREGSTGVAIINQTLAGRIFGSADPIGKRINTGTTAQPDWREIVGVAGDVKSFGLDKETHSDLYRPYGQVDFPLISFVIKTASDPASLTHSIQSAIWTIDPDQPFFKVVTMNRLASESVALRRTSMILMAAFAGLALLLASVGIYGVISYWASQRGHEIGIRMALGASRTDILKLILKQGETLFAVGLVIGLAGAFAAARFSASVLFGVSAVDPAVFLFGPLFLAAVATAACYIPAKRATKVDPMKALRYE